MSATPIVGTKAIRGTSFHAWEEAPTVCRQRQSGVLRTEHQRYQYAHPKLGLSRLRGRRGERAQGEKRSASPIALFVPENGFIALNAPLTRRRIGSHSTRTTHPRFLGQMQSLFDTMNLPVHIENPYRHKTKGEMLVDLAPGEELKGTTVATVSCGKWKRKSQQCGHCVPCLIRRAAFAKAGIADTTPYQYTDLGHVWDRPDIRDDIMAMLVAVGRDHRGARQRAIAGGALPFDAVERKGWFGVHERGLEEVGAYLRSQGLGT